MSTYKVIVGGNVRLIYLIRASNLSQAAAQTIYWPQVTVEKIK